MSIRTLGWERFRKPLIIFVGLMFIGSLLSGFLGGKNDRLSRDLALSSVSITQVWPPDALASESPQTGYTEDWRGQPVLVTFWATWCGYCRDEMPMLERLHQEFGPLGVRVVSVSAERSYGKIRSMAQAKGVTYPIYADASALFKHYTVDPIPFHVFIGRDGKVAGDITGQMDEQDAKTRLEALLEP